MNCRHSNHSWFFIRLPNSLICFIFAVSIITKGGFTVTRKFLVSTNGQKGRLKHKFDSLGYYYTRNLSFHRNITQDLQDITGNFLVTVEISTTV